MSDLDTCLYARGCFGGVFMVYAFVLSIIVFGMGLN